MKNNNPLISVILPVYNVEKYILQCLESISNQTYTKLEVIIVVDGATDKSYKIAKDYLEKDNRFHLIYQENAGSGPARNNGLNHANGEFVIFIDPDDWIKNDYIETLYKIYLANNVDLVITSGTDIFFDNQDNIIKKIHKDIPEIKLNTKEEARDNYIKLYSLNMLSGPAQKLYRMEIIRKYNIEFPALRRSQDIVFNYRYYNHINSLKSINYQGYQYRINKSSYASKLPENYYCIIGQIYSEIKSLHDSWNITLEDTTLSNICFSSIINYIESMIIRKHKYSQNLNNPIIKHIIETADPHNIYKKIIHLLLKKKLYFIVNLIIKSKILAKRIYY